MLNKLQWLGTGTSIIGSFAVAMGMFIAGYSAFLIGSISWLIVGFTSKNRPLIVLNGFFLLANLIGGFRAVFY